MGISTGSGVDDGPMSDINTTPLVDVMLVLLIIFLITIPVILESVDLRLPDVAFEPTTTKPENVLLSIRTPDSNGDGVPDGTGECQVFWGNTPIDSTTLLTRGQKTLEDLLADIGGVENITEENFPEVHIRGDVATPYKCIGGVIYTMQYAGFQKIGFISQPTGAAALRARD